MVLFGETEFFFFERNLSFTIVRKKRGRTMKITIGDITLQNQYFLGTCQDYHDAAMRNLCRTYGASLCFSEKIRSNEILKKTRDADLKLFFLCKDQGSTVFHFSLDDLEHAFAAFEQALPFVQNTCQFILLDFSKIYDSIHLYEDWQTQINGIIDRIQVRSGKPILLDVDLRKNKHQRFHLACAMLTDRIQGIYLECNRCDASYIVGHLHDLTKVPVVLALTKSFVWKRDGKTKYDSYDADAFAFTAPAIGHPEIFEDLLLQEQGIHHVRYGLIRHGDDLKKLIDLEYDAYPKDIALTHCKKHLAHFFEDYVNAEDVKRELRYLRTYDELVNLASEIQYK